MASSQGRHRFIDHTSEIELEIDAKTLSGLLVEAGTALAVLLLRQPRLPVPETPSRRIEVSSHDAEALLVDWLNEIIYLAETSLWVPVAFDPVDISRTSLVIDARGVRVSEPPASVKAATLHGLRIASANDALRAKVILDV